MLEIPAQCPLLSPKADKLLRCRECPLNANRDRRTAAAFYSISSNSTRIHGSHLQMEEPSTASKADSYTAANSATNRSLCRRGAMSISVPSRHRLASLRRPVLDQDFGDQANLNAVIVSCPVAA